LVAGELEAVFLPGRGMLGASLRHRGVEILGRVEELETAAAKGSTAGIPLLYPWANRLAGACYSVAGKEVSLDLSSPLLHLDAHGLPIHGVPWSLLAWEVTAVSKDTVTARLEWGRSELLAIFPYHHRIELTATLRSEALTIETTLTASLDGPVPVSFGFHPYLRLPELPRAQWWLQLPAMRRLVLDQHGIPTGAEELFHGFDAPLGTADFDDGFALSEDCAVFLLTGAGRRISVEFLAGYPYAQVYAPKNNDYVAFEPMTAPTNSLTSGCGLRVVEPGGEFRTAFRIKIDEVS
jgi:galactose mutarotase-like enzyme